MKKSRVLVVDDSNVLRSMLVKIISKLPEFEVVGTAANSYEARDKVLQLNPDVITLDIEMPGVDGISFLKALMQHFPIPTVIVSSVAQSGSRRYFEAMEAGAIDILPKPTENIAICMKEFSQALSEKLKVAASSKVRKENSSIVLKNSNQSLHSYNGNIFTIASSTGGTEALKVVLRLLPDVIPPTLIVQHMPPIFTKAYADSLQKLCKFEVKEAADGDLLKANRVLLAPGDFHMEIVKRGVEFQIALNQKPHLHGVRPAADYLMESAAKYFGQKVIAAVLTGMGVDGARGALAIKQNGGRVFAQSERTCVVYGMPKAAVDIGAVDKVVDLNQIARALVQEAEARRAA